jgi:hypothetical protein
VIEENGLPDRDIAFESQTHSASNPLEFLGGLGRALGKKQMLFMMHNHQLGDLGDVDSGIRQRQLSANVNNGNGFGEQFVRSLLEEMSMLLKECGLRHTASSPNQESRLSNILGYDVGRLARKFCALVVTPLERTGLDCVTSFNRKRIAQGFLATLLIHDAKASGDKRRLNRIWPKLTALDQQTVDFFTKMNLLNGST